MAGPVWGVAEIQITADGSILPSQIRRITKDSGDAAGTTFAKSFNQSLNRNRGSILSNWRSLLSNIGNLTNALLPRRIGTALRTIGTGIRDAAREAKANAPSFKEFWSQVSPSKEDWRQTFPGLTRVIERTGVAIKTTRDRVREWLPDWGRIGTASRGIGSSLKNLFSTLDSGNGSVAKAGKSMDGFGNSIRRLPHGFRQAIFWTTLFVASLAQMSGLGSALAGTMIALGTALVGLAAGAGLAVVGFMGLFEEGAKLNKGAAESLSAFQALGKQFGELQSVITNAMFDGMADSIKGVGGAITALTPALEGFASIVGSSIADVFDALSSDKGVANFKALIDGFGPIFTSLTDAVIGFGGAIANIMIAALPTAQIFSEAIAEVGRQFETWTASEEGRARLAEFFSTAERIMPLVVDLFVAAGRALAGLVTPTTLNGLEQFLVSLTAAMPAVEGLLRVAGNLNVFGILAAALDAVGAALTPMLPAFEQLATVLGQGILDIIKALVPVFTSLGLTIGPIVAAITPLVSLLLNLVSTILPILLSAITPILTVIQQLAPVIIGALMPAFGAIATVAVQLVTALAPLVQMLGPILGGIIQSVVPIISALVDVFIAVIDAIMPLIASVIPMLVPLIIQVAKVFTDVAKVITPIIRAILPVLEDLLGAVIDVVLALIPVVLAVIQPFLKLIQPLLQLIIPILPPLVSLLSLVAQVVATLLVPIIKALTPVISLLAQVIAGILVNALKVITPIIEGVSKVFTWLLKNVITPLATFISGVLVRAIEGISRALESVIGWIKDAINWFGSLFGAANEAGSAGRSNTQGFASGGVLVGPRRILAGEAGPEAIVPLNRALSQVDPSVRWLSAIAQNKSTPAMASGGVVGGGNVVNIGEGAVQVYDAGNARQTAYDVLDVLANRIAG
jgi:phage-related protein